MSFVQNGYAPRVAKQRHNTRDNVVFSKRREGVTPGGAEMIWVGNFKSLQLVLHKPRFGAPLEVHTWLRSETGLISPFADWLMSLIARSGCVRGKEEFVELALREAITNAILHGNRFEPRKLVHVRCCCEGTKGVFIAVRDQGHGSTPILFLILSRSKTWKPNTGAAST